ncbi:hypothetical protein FPOA_06869 [Fusarium poae]|uniref:Fe2OG dioxygenase domain-containing protein n=1 Tax=Fusarium poae TaxID=36050 RepID=A0A1B8AJE8_FUSPO|nr:hypothetical protein FPOA_06869 [Fusarium poae]
MESQMEPQPMEMDLPYQGAPVDGPSVEASSVEALSVETLSVKDPSVEDLLKDVSSAIRKKGVFAIGGHVQDIGKLAIQWADKTNGQCHTLRFPLTDGASQDSFNALLNGPATMDADDFFTNFSPYVHGILAAINQTLPWSTHWARHQEEDEIAVKAELCKLDVYSASSGRSETYVDNPLLDRQMGTLVICLPVPHKGGQLAVRHRDRQVKFDWASQHPNTVQWAAFISDREHEVLPITEGHRLTLTYRLLGTDYTPCLMANELKGLDQELLDFYTGLVKLIEKMKSTGEQYILGFSCTNQYPHTSRSSYEYIHHMLKGMDLLVYQALKRNLRGVRVGTVLDDSQYVESQRELKEMELERLEEIANNTQGRWGRKWPYDYDEEALDEDTVCMTKSLSPAWVEDWYRDDEDGYCPDPVNNIDGGFSRAKVKWLNCAPEKRMCREFSVAVASVAERHPSVTWFDSAAVIFAWVGFEYDD